MCITIITIIAMVGCGMGTRPGNTKDKVSVTERIRPQPQGCGFFVPAFPWAGI